jgi:hypothetical protein
MGWFGHGIVSGMIATSWIQWAGQEAGQENDND